MRIVWCKELEDVVGIAQSLGWLLSLEVKGNHYYYVYAETRAELFCIAVKVDEPLKEKYVSIDSEGKLKTSDKPIMPSCARITSVIKDEEFEEILK